MIRRVSDFLSKKARIERDKVLPQSRLLHDLGIDGDDAAEILFAIAETFQIDMSGFCFDRYFNPEPSFINALWFSPWQRKARLNRKCPLTIEELAAAAQKGEWGKQGPSSTAKNHIEG